MKRERFSTDITRIQFDSMEEWLVNRKGIGGSDASAILGLNPYKTNQELWMEKKGQMSPVDISDKPYVKYGNDAEPLLRALFALDYPEYKVEYYDNNMIINKIIVPSPVVTLLLGLLSGVGCTLAFFFKLSIAFWIASAILSTSACFVISKSRTTASFAAFKFATDSSV